MAGGNNAAFIANTKEYIRTHPLMISPQGIGSQASLSGCRSQCGSEPC